MDRTKELGEGEVQRSNKKVKNQEYCNKSPIIYINIQNQRKGEENAVDG